MSSSVCMMMLLWCFVVRVPKETRNPPSTNPVAGGRMQPYIETKLVCVRACVCVCVCVCVRVRVCACA